MNALVAQALAAGWDEDDTHPACGLPLVHVDPRFLVFARPDREVVARVDHTDSRGNVTRAGERTVRAGAVMTRLRWPDAEHQRAANLWRAEHEDELRRAA